MNDPHRSSLPPSSASNGSLSDDDSAPSFGEAGNPDVPEPFREAVAELHDQVQTAADTIRELRAENERLRQKVEDLSERPDVSDDDAFILLDGEREDLRERIQSFIDAIDEHLETAPASGIDPAWPDEPPSEPEPSDEMEETHDESPEDESGEPSDPAASTLQDGLPDDGEFKVEVPESAEEDEDRPTSKRSPCRDEYTSEPRTIGPGLQPRRSARRRR